MSRILVVGGDGLIGRALTEALRLDGRDVLTTSYRDPLPEKAVLLDLTRPDIGITDGVDCMVLCAAITGRAECEADPNRAHQVNVEAPCALGASVLARGGHVIFVSTSIVLGGATPYISPNAPYAPFDTYSRSKAEAEQRLLALPGAPEGLAILRLCKVLDARIGVVAEWSAAAANGRPITPFTDLVTAPMTVDHVTDRLAQMIETGATGIHQLSGIEHSYAEVASRLAAALKWPARLIRPVEGRRTNVVAAQNLPHASLETENPVPLDEVIDRLARQLT